MRKLAGVHTVKLTPHPLPWGVETGARCSIHLSHLSNAFQLLPWIKGGWKQCLEGIGSSDFTPMCADGMGLG